MVRAMRVVTRPEDLPRDTPTVVSIGNFDGLHRGHAALVAQVEAEAARSQDRLRRPVRRAILTLEPHPLALLAPERAPPRIVSRAEKHRLLAAAGVELLYEQPFTPAFAALSPTDFAASVLSVGLGAVAVVVGYDFRYGRGRCGDVNALRASGEAWGFAVREAAAVRLPDGTPASSSLVRRALIAGDLPLAHLALGRRHAVTGLVEAGDGRGRDLGFPTANITPDGGLLPADGVYAAWLDAGWGPRPAVVNLGHRPTFVDASPGRRLEAHLLGVAGAPNLYGAGVRLTFEARLREERRFSGVEALRAAIEADVAQAAALLGASPPP
jgi:riboflavin kinase/FMN adenylyltransferase